MAGGPMRVDKCVTHHHACDCREAKFTEIDSENNLLRTLVLELKTGDCWCGVGIGNPAYKNHSRECIALTRYFKWKGSGSKD